MIIIKTFSESKFSTSLNNGTETNFKVKFQSKQFGPQLQHRKRRLKSLKTHRRSHAKCYDNKIESKKTIAPPL